MRHLTDCVWLCARFSRAEGARRYGVRLNLTMRTVTEDRHAAMSACTKSIKHRSHTA